MNVFGGFLAGSIVGRMLMDTTRWTASVTKVKADQKTLSGMSAKTAKSFQRMGRAMTLAGTAITGIFGMMVKQASDAEETYAKFGTVFKDVASSAEKAARDLAESYGLSTIAAKDMLGATGDLLTGLGVVPDVALDLSEKTQRLAVDLASFTNYSGGAKGASEALTKAMLGERESIKSLGIVITEEMVKERLLAQGKGDLTGLAYKQAAAEATLQLAYEQSKNAIGDYQRTSDSLANRSRLLKARLQDIAVTFGTQLIPVATEIVGKITSVVLKIKEWADAHPQLTSVIVKGAAAVGALMTALGPVVVIFPRLISGFTAVGRGIKVVATGMQALRAVSLATLGPITLLTSALAALAIGYLKVKKAQDAATESAKRSAEAEDDLFRRIKAATDAAGMSELAFHKLAEKYHYNAAAMAMAIKRGKEGEDLQKALIEASKKHHDAKRVETGAIDDLAASLNEQLVPAMGAVVEKQESWIEFLREQGLQTISEKKERANELYGIIDNLNAAYERGEISTATWAEAVKSATKEIEALTSAEYVEVGASRDLSAAIQQVSATMDSAVFSYEDVKEAGAEAAKETANSWVAASTTIQTGWTDTFKGMLTGTTSWRDGLGSIWSNIKGEFSSFTSLLSGDWKENFLKKGILGVKDFASNLIQSFGSLGKSIGSIFGNLGSSISGIFKGLGGIGKSISGIVGGIGKIAQGFSPGGIISGAIGGLVGGLFGKKGLGKTSGENIRKTAEFTQSLRDIVQKDIRDNQLNWIIGRQDVANSALTGILPNKFDAVNKRLDRVKEYTNKTARACEAMVKALKGVTSAAQGAIVRSTELVMVHGRPSMPEVIMNAPTLNALVAQAGGGGGRPVVVNDNRKVEVRGTMITDRDYVRQRLLPEILAALDANSGHMRRKLKEYMGI